MTRAADHFRERIDWGAAPKFVSVGPTLEAGDRVLVPDEKVWGSVVETERWTDDAGQSHTLATLDIDNMGRFRIRAALVVKLIGDVGPDDEVELRLTSPIRFLSKKDDGQHHP